MAQNEKTSERVAAIASKILKMNKPSIMTTELWEEIKTLAASALTQAPDKIDPVTSAAASTAFGKLKGLGGLNLGQQGGLLKAFEDSKNKK